LFFVALSYGAEPVTVVPQSPDTAKAFPTMVVRQNISHDVSKPLRDLAKNTPVFKPEAQEEAEEVKVIPLGSGFKPASEPDPVLQKPVMTAEQVAAAAAARPTMGLNFEGLGIGFPNYHVAVAPPDTNGAVGLTQYVQWVNLSFAVFDKTSGKVILGPMAGNTLWAGFGGGCETENDGDPIVLYDKLADRWVFSQLVVNSGPFLQCVAVSTTSDATGTYNRYSFEYSNFDDYPKMGVWPDAYYETFNMFVGGISFAGADACAYDRNAMLKGQPAAQICFQQAPSVGGMLPADVDGHSPPPAGSPNYMVVFDVNALDLYKFHVDFATPANSTFTGPINIPVAPFTPFCPSVRGCVPQPGTSGTKLDSLGDRLMYRLAYRNFGDHESLVVNHSVVADPVSQNSGVRWYEIQNPNGATPPVVAQQSTFAPDSGYRWMGSVAMDVSGDLAVGYTVINATSNPPIFASGAIAARTAVDPPSTLQPETTIIAGAGEQIGLTRWGDYSAMQVDPVDDCTFWYTTEYLSTTGSFNWNTRIVNFKFPGCGAPDLSIAKSHVGKLTQGQVGATYAITVTNVGGKPTDGSVVTVTDTLPAGLAATSISSTDPAWACNLGTLSCTRNDVLASGSSYGPITLTVNVAVNAPGFVTNTATVAGGGSKDNTDNTANDLTTIIVTGPDPTIAKTHVPMVQGQSGTYTITVTNVGLSATDPTQTLTVSDTLPSGFTATAAGGSGWGCSLGPTVTCTRSDSLASNQSYPPITLSVNVPSGGSGLIVNTASVSGGGDVNPLNNAINDPTVLFSAPPGMAITSPPPPLVLSGANEFKPGTKIAITGTATGPSFQDFRMQWAEGSNPTAGWSSSGITLAGGGTAPVTKGSLGTWDTTGITTADYYTLQVLVDDAGFTNEVSTIVYLEPSLLSVNWPVNLAVSPELNSGFVPAVQASGAQRLALVTPIYLQTETLPPQYLSFAADNSSQNVVNLPQPSYLNPAVGNIDGSPGEQVVIPDAPGPFGVPQQMQIFRADNTSFTFSLGQSFVTQSVIFDQPVLVDVNGTGEQDVVSLSNNFNRGFGVEPAVLFAWHPDGSLLGTNFPITIPDLNVDLQLSMKPRVFVADLQGSGSKQFVVEAGLSATTFTLQLFAANGTPIPWAVPVLSERPVNLALADLDHNGKLETLLLVTNTSGTSLHVFQPDGTERPGFPVAVGFESEAHIAVGDLNRDGVEEIVVLVRNDSLMVLEPDGTAFPGAWAQSAPNENLSGPIVLADINGDGAPEILLTAYHLAGFSTPASAETSANPVGRSTVETIRDQQGLISHSVNPVVESAQQNSSLYWIASIIAVNQEATIVRRWNLPGANGNQPYSQATITVGDFDQDGTTDLAVNNFTIAGGGIGGFLTGGVDQVLTTGAKFNAQANDWPMVYHDPQQTAILRRDVTLSITTPVAGATVSGTVQVTAAVAGSVASVQFKLNGTALGAPITAAPFTLSWDTKQAANGRNDLVAVATNTSGRLIASAPITVTVTGAKQPTTVALALTAGTNPANLGSSLSFQATVTPNSSTGTVVFFDGSTPISGNLALNNGAATFTTSSLSVGVHSISAQYSGDANFTSSSSPPFAEKILTPSSVVVALTAGTNPANPGSSLTFQATVTPNSASGTVVFLDGSTPISGDLVLNNGVAALATSLSSAGTHSITAQYSGDANFASSTSASFAEKILTPTSVVVTLTAGTNPANLGSSLSFQATVTPNSATGTVAFFDGNTAISGNLPLNGASATFTTSSLAAGTHSLTAEYSGDANFVSSTSPAWAQNVMDFTITASPTSATIAPGASATFTFTVTPIGGFNQTVSFSCAGLPARAQCSFAPPSLAPNGSPATSTLTITTTASSAASLPPPLPGNSAPLYASLFGATLGMAGLILARRARTSVKIVRLWLGLAVLCVLASLTSCGGGGGSPQQPGTPPGTSQVTVTTSVGTSNKTASITLVVQ
jgi:uncharacterized repeat protein (TIGR01451 family)